jgi:type II secretory pathway predicted ATPase ExeA
MYKQFYHLQEKPFTLLPDPDFLFLSDKHRMALTLLEYGLTNQAGFTVISGEIGAGKTTLIRHLLNNLDREFTVGLITNTHRSFGELLEWILLAFNLEHKGMNKVEMYQRFIDFIISEYGKNRRTVLIVDEAQNMDAETLEELRMLSNINADKDQALQIVLSGQRELRDTLRKPELVQFAQRIAVDYHLEPLSKPEVAGYVRHRMEVAGGDPDTFTPAACAAIQRYTGGIPRLINLLCDTALVYGYAEQRPRIDARLVTEVAREKQQGGIFPVTVPAEQLPEDEESNEETVAVEDESAAAQQTPQPEAVTPAAPDTTPVTDTTPAPAVEEAPAAVAREAEAPAPPPTESEMSDAEFRWLHGQTKKKLRLAVCAAEPNSREYLSGLLENSGFEVIAQCSLDPRQLAQIDSARLDVLLIDRDETTREQSVRLACALPHWHGPVLFYNSRHRYNPRAMRQLVAQILALDEPAPPARTAANR